MDARQETRDRFDRVMRVPDRIVEIVGLISLGSGCIFIMELISPSQPLGDFMVLFFSIHIGIYAICALYFAFRFVAALIISAQAVRSIDRANSRASDHPADRPDAQARTALPL